MCDISVYPSLSVCLCEGMRASLSVSTGPGMGRIGRGYCFLFSRCERVCVCLCLCVCVCVSEWLKCLKGCRGGTGAWPVVPPDISTCPHPLSIHPTNTSAPTIRAHLLSTHPTHTSITHKTMQLFAVSNSGTYNSEWMVLDPPNKRLWVLDQVCVYVFV